MKNTTITQYHAVIHECKTLFDAKMSDYGTSWVVMRPSTITDQLLIKANRIKTLEINKSSAVIGEGIRPEYIALINYSIIGMILLSGEPIDTHEKVSTLYSKFSEETFQLMLRKNTDYGEVWRDMRITSMTDLILAKLYRVKQIEDNDGSTSVSEGIDANYQDILNYSIFSTILFDERKEN